MSKEHIDLENDKFYKYDTEKLWVPHLKFREILSWTLVGPGEVEKLLKVEILGSDSLLSLPG